MQQDFEEENKKFKIMKIEEENKVSKSINSDEKPILRCNNEIMDFNDFGYDYQTYKKEYEDSIANKSEYFERNARVFLDWFKPFSKTYNNEITNAKWFEDGYINACYNAIDRHASKTPNKVAIIEINNEGEQCQYTFYQSQQEIMKIANYLNYKLDDCKDGVNCVAVYMPMCAKAVFTVLACARLGIVHNVIFGGFNAESLAMRVFDSKAKMIVTVDYFNRERKKIDFLSNVSIACSILKKENKECVESILVFNEKETHITTVYELVQWSNVINNTIKTLDIDSYIACKPLKAEHPLFFLYTSGSTGKPKGIMHTTGGYLLYSAMTTKKIFNIKNDDVFFCTADLGWITGHSYSVYGPLVNGCTTVIFGGVPTYPTEMILFELVSKCKITHLYTAPTLIRMLQKIFKEKQKNAEEINMESKKDSLTVPVPEKDAFLLNNEGQRNVYKTNEGFINHGYDLSSLRILGSVGEPINKDAYHWFRKEFGPGLPLVDTYWQTESGGIMISPIVHAVKPVPECASLPFFGMEPIFIKPDVGIIHEKANISTVKIESTHVSEYTEIKDGQLGSLAFKGSWPGVARTIFNNHERYIQAYFKYDGFYLTGDEGYTKDGLFWIRGRFDDVLNISGHRMSTAEIESAACSDVHIVECAVVSIEDEITGQALILFVVPKDKSIFVDFSTNKMSKITSNVVCESIKKSLRDRIGPIVAAKKIFIVDELPKTRTGKIMRRVLRCILKDQDIGDLSTCNNVDCISHIQNLIRLIK